MEGGFKGEKISGGGWIHSGGRGKGSKEVWKGMVSKQMQSGCRVMYGVVVVVTSMSACAGDRATIYKKESWIALATHGF